MSKFWEHYAKANDDIRSKLIDEAWFERKTGDTPFLDDVRDKAKEAERNPGFEPQPVVAEPTAEQQEAESRREAVYGPPSVSPPANERENGQQPYAYEAGYGYDALDEPER